MAVGWVCLFVKYVKVSTSRYVNNSLFFQEGRRDWRHLEMQCCEGKVLFLHCDGGHVSS